MRILLLGETGLIGHAIGKSLRRNHEVVSASRSDKAHRIDLNDLVAIDSFDFSGFDAVVHAAGVTDEEVKADLKGAILRATLGASRVFEKAKVAGVAQAVYISSAHVYGPMVGIKEESTPVNPITDYALCHYWAEQALRSRFGSLKALIVRPNAVFGLPPNLESFGRWSLIPFAFPKELALQGTITLKSPGTQGRNFIATDDIGDGVSAFLENPNGAGCHVWNPQGPLQSSVYEFGLRCMDVYKEIRGAEATLSRPEPTGTEPEYRLVSEHRWFSPSRYPDEVVRQLIERLS